MVVSGEVMRMNDDIIAILLAVAGSATPNQMRKLVSSLHDGKYVEHNISKITLPKPYDDYYVEFDYDLNKWIFKGNALY